MHILGNLLAMLFIGVLILRMIIRALESPSLTPFTSSGPERPGSTSRPKGVQMRSGAPSPGRRPGPSIASSGDRSSSPRA